MGDFVTGQGYGSKASRCVVYSVPVPFHLVERKRVAGPSLAETKKAETDAQLKQNDTDAKASQKRRAKPSNGRHFGLAPVAPIVSQYETSERMGRIHREVERIRHEAETVRAVFATIVKPNSKQRRTLKRVLARLQHEMDTLPNK